MTRYTLLLLLSPFLFSCINTRKAVYFNNLTDTTLTATALVPEPVLQPNDLLSITVSSLNPNASIVFNQPNRTDVQSTTVAGDQLQPAGYLVNSDGTIRFPMLGTIKVAGLTKKQLQDYIRTSLVEKKLLLDPVIEIRYLNYKVSVLGEVARPTVITVPSEKITLLEALSLAGDITTFGKKDNIMVIREESGKKLIRRIDLNSSELFSSPYYYLKSNDIVYVEPNKARVASATRFYQLLPSIVSGLSAAIIIFDRVSRN